MQAAIDADWRTALPVLAALFLGSRLVAILAALVGEAVNPSRPGWQLTTQVPILRSLTSWDGVYYAAIATHGYSADPVLHDRLFPNYVFFPALPALMRVVHALTGIEPAMAGLLIGNVSFALAMLALYALARRHLGQREALIAVGFSAFAPGATAFSMSYGDGLFLLVVALAFLAAETRHDGVVALCYAAATLTRLPGITLGLPLLILLIRADGRRPTRRWVSLAAGPLALAVFYGYLWTLTGDPLANIHGQAAWSDQTLPPLPPILVAGLVALVFAMVAMVAASGAMLYRMWREKLAPEYVAYAAVGLAVIVATLRVVSLPRYLAVLFPLAWGFAAHPYRRVLMAASIVLYFVFSFAAFGPGLAP